MAEFRLPVGATELLAYFEGVARHDPRPHWREGAEMCRRWMDLASRSPRQSDIIEFAARLDAEPAPGSGWLDLAMQFRHWARCQGFEV